jgi:hypothetical protein
MPADPVLAGFDRADGRTRARLTAVQSLADKGRPALVEVEALGVLVDIARKGSWRVALEQPDWGSGERYQL